MHDGSPETYLRLIIKLLQHSNWHRDIYLRVVSNIISLFTSESYHHIVYSSSKILRLNIVTNKIIDKYKKKNDHNKINL